jgi:OOP family OmpA-OmpF porin
MKKPIILILFLSSINFVNSQNLVPNGSFEEYYECPVNQGDFFVDDWFKAPYSNGSPDYFNDCSPEDTWVDVPENIFGYQFPHEGEGYAGLFCYGSDSQQREYIEISLESPLIEGQEYEFSMWVSLPEKYNYGVNNLGALFTDYQVQGNGQYNPNLIEADPQVKAETPIIDKENWTQITGTFIAEGGEEYLTLGNFFSDEETEILYVGGGDVSNRTHYYFDSVSLTPRSLSNNENRFENRLNIYPNPINENINIEIIDNQTIINIKLYTILGELVLERNMDDQHIKIDISELSTGIYLLEITDLQSNHVVKRISKV